MFKKLIWLVKWRPDSPRSVLAVLIAFVALVDLTNIDSMLYKISCSIMSSHYCADFYDIPIWEGAMAVGTIAAAYYAYIALRESNRRLEIDQRPYVVIKDSMKINPPIFSNPQSFTQETVLPISLINIGKGSAINITASADPDGEISLIDASNPNSIDLINGGYNTGWAVDRGQLMEGLKKQGIVFPTNSVFDDIPDEGEVDPSPNANPEFNIYLRYSDQLGNKFLTKTTLRKSRAFCKVMRNSLEILPQ